MRRFILLTACVIHRPWCCRDTYEWNHHGVIAATTLRISSNRTGAALGMRIRAAQGMLRFHCWMPRHHARSRTSPDHAATGVMRTRLENECFGGGDLEQQDRGRPRNERSARPKGCCAF